MQENNSIQEQTIERIGDGYTSLIMVDVVSEHEADKAIDYFHEHYKVLSESIIHMYANKFLIKVIIEGFYRSKETFVTLGNARYYIGGNSKLKESRHGSN